jgi:phage protein D
MPTPDFRLTLDGVDLSSKVRPRLIGLTLTEKREADSDQLDITLSDADGRLAIPPEGALLTLSLGFAGALVDKGQFKVDEIEHSGAPDVLTIRARAVDFTAATRTRNLATFKDTTLGAIVRQLAANAGLQARIAPALAGLAIDIIEQGRMSDTALLKRLGRRYDATATVKAGNLLFNPIGAGTTAGGTPLPGATIRRSDGDSHSFKRAARNSYTGVTAYWHDPAQAERRAEDVGTSDGEGTTRRLKRTYGNQADARAAATAELNRLQRGAATLSFTLALGRPELYPEQRLTLQGFKPEIDAVTWLIVEATHTLGDQGLTTALQLETAI